MADNSTQQKILEAAIECIEHEGVDRTTIRKIARIADVNSAAINYYFRTKDHLIRRALDYSLENAFDWDDFKASRDFAPAERVRAIILDLLNGTLQYPGIARAHFHPITSRGDYDTPAVKAITHFLERLKMELIQKGIKLQDPDLRQTLTQIISATLIPAIFAPRLFYDFSGTDFSNPETLPAYLQNLIIKLFATAPSETAAAITIREADPSSELDIVRGLFTEYVQELGADLGFQGFQEELAGLPGEYAHPNGSLYLATIDEQAAGCVALRRIDTETCEMKRLFVRPSCRKYHIGRALVRTIIISGRAHGYKIMKLDTLERLEAAYGLYRSFGFRETTAYTYNPLPGAVYMELAL